MIQLKLSSNTDSFIWQPDVSTFLHSYIYRFVLKYKQCTYDNIKIKLDVYLCHEAINYIKEALDDCIRDLYTDPDIKMLNKHPSRFEKIFANNIKYTINYTTSLAGRLIYSIYSVYTFLTKEIEKNEYIILELGSVG